MVTQNQVYFLHLLRNEGCKKMAKHPKNALKWGFFSKIQRNTLPDTQKIAKRGINGKTRHLATSNICHLGNHLQACSPVARYKILPFLFGGLDLFIYLCP